MVKYLFSSINQLFDYIMLLTTWFYIFPEKYNLDEAAVRLSHQKDMLIFVFLAILFIVRIFIAIRKYEKIAIENDILKEELRAKKIQNDIDEIKNIINKN